eukprot:gene22804-biopygen31451
MQLIETCKMDDANELVSLLDQGANVDFCLLEPGAPEVCTMGKTHLLTPLFVTAMIGQVECMKALLDHGADMNTLRYNNNTPLHAAAKQGNIECVKALLSHGADVSLFNNKGHTALDAAVEGGHQDVADAIRNHMRMRTDAQQGEDQGPAQNSSTHQQTNKRKFSSQPAAAARLTIDECEEQLALAKLRNDEYVTQLAVARSRINECERNLASARRGNEVYKMLMSCMTVDKEVLASQTVQQLERLLADLDVECLRRAIFDKCLQREIQKARARDTAGTADDRGVCQSAPK